MALPIVLCGRNEWTTKQIAGAYKAPMRFAPHPGVRSVGAVCQRLSLGSGQFQLNLTITGIERRSR